MVPTDTAVEKLQGNLFSDDMDALVLDIWELRGIGLD